MEAYRAPPFTVAGPATDLRIDAGRGYECTACARGVGDGSVMEGEERGLRS